MPLTPIDVQQKTFGTALRGYDLDEVDDFLDEVVTALKDYDQRLRDAQERISSLESELDGRGDAEGAIARALVAAQRSADAIVEEARAQAEAVVSEARGRASAMTTERDEEQSRLLREIQQMREAVETLRSGVHELSASVEKDLDEMGAAVESADASVRSIPDDGDQSQPDEFERPTFHDDISEYAEQWTGEGAEPDDADAWRLGGPRHAAEEESSTDEQGSEAGSADPWSVVSPERSEEQDAETQAEDRTDEWSFAGTGVHHDDQYDVQHDTGEIVDIEGLEVEEAAAAVASDEEQTRSPRPWERG